MYLDTKFDKRRLVCYAQSNPGKKNLVLYSLVWKFCKMFDSSANFTQRNWILSLFHCPQYWILTIDISTKTSEYGYIFKINISQACNKEIKITFSTIVFVLMVLMTSPKQSKILSRGPNKVLQISSLYWKVIWTGWRHIKRSLEESAITGLYEVIKWSFLSETFY